MRRAFGLAVSLLLGCGGVETRDRAFEGTVGYDAFVIEPGQVSLLHGSSSVVVHAAWLALGDVRLERCGGLAVEIPGPGVRDHVGSQARVTHVETLGADEYCRFSLALEPSPQQPSAAPAELDGQSILLLGTYEERDFRIASALSKTVTLDVLGAERGYTFDGEDSGVVFSFNLTTWLSDLPWTTVATDESGTLAIDAEHSPEPLRVFETRVERGIQLVVDADHDGERDADWRPIAGEY